MLGLLLAEHNTHFPCHLSFVWPCFCVSLELKSHFWTCFLLGFCSVIHPFSPPFLVPLGQWCQNFDEMFRVWLIGLPPEYCGQGHQSNESYERKRPWNCTISTVLWVHRKCPQSTVKPVLPSNESYETLLWEQNGLWPYPCNRPLSTPNMTGRRFHRTMEMMPRPPPW